MSQPTCLIVDDSRMVRRVVSRIVRELDFASQEAENGLDALEQCRMNMPDAILLDWNMPVMDGLTFVKHLRNETDGQNPTVIFCSSERDVHKIAEALDAGANEYVMKPFDSDIIHSKFFQAGLITA
ncbi:MAG: response regulator [Maricaulaceae bacterium]